MRWIEYLLESYSKFMYWLNDRCTECGASFVVHPIVYLAIKTENDSL